MALKTDPLAHTTLLVRLFVAATFFALPAIGHAAPATGALAAGELAQSATPAIAGACPRGISTAGPIYWDMRRLRAVKAARADDPSVLSAAFDALIKKADKALDQEPYSVTDKSIPPPSGDLHDYRSLATYWWPDPSTEDGLPYIRKDGYANPERNGPEFDRRRAQNMTDDVFHLAVAAYLTGDARYARQAANFITTWFINPETRMNPNLTFGQGIPGRVDGRDVGIIDSRIYTDVIDAVLILSAADMIDPSVIAGTKRWFGSYAKWLIESDLGKEERAAVNNHGTFYDSQLAHFLIFSGRCDVARSVVKDTPFRAKSQIRRSGVMPLEASRTRSLHYHAFNLEAFLHLARLGDRLGVDVYTKRPRRAGSIQDAVLFLAAYAGREEEWRYERLDNRGAATLWAMLRRATLLDNDDDTGTAIRDALERSNDESKDDIILLLTY